MTAGQKRVIGSVIGVTAIGFMSLSALLNNVPERPSGIEAGNGPYVTFPSPSPPPSAVVSTSTTIPAASTNTAG